MNKEDLTLKRNGVYAIKHDQRTNKPTNFELRKYEFITNVFKKKMIMFKNIPIFYTYSSNIHSFTKTWIIGYFFLTWFKKGFVIKILIKSNLMQSFYRKKSQEDCLYLW